MDNCTKIPKVFISYSWEPEEHAKLTLRLAKRLSSDGVDVVFDKWNLTLGNDTVVFMEKMVNDDTIDFVLLICNKIYSEKADKRKGGVGIEGTIISSEIYNNIAQNKFIPVVIETDNEGRAYKPTYLKPAFHIDLSREETFEEEYMQLVRHIHGKPLHVKPLLGNSPGSVSKVGVN